MNSKLFMMASGVVLTACSASSVSESYTVTADVPNELNGQTAFLVNFDTGEKIDSVTVAEEKAVFTGTTTSPTLARIVINGSRFGAVVLEAGDITVKERMASGSPLNDINKSIAQRTKEFSEQYDAAPQDSTGDAMRQQIMDAYNAYADSVFLANVDNPIGYSLYLEKAYDLPLNEMEALLNEHPALKGYVRVNNLLTAAKNKEATMPGKKFIDFTIKSDSTSQSLSDYVGKGKPVLVDFWASWCGPCIRETKVIKELLDEYGPQGLEVLGVAVWDEPQNTLQAIENHKLPWNQILNAQSIPTDLYGISGIPCILLISPDGTILSRGKQGHELRADVKAMMEGTLTPESIQ